MVMSNAMLISLRKQKAEVSNCTKKMVKLHHFKSSQTFLNTNNKKDAYRSNYFVMHDISLQIETRLVWGLCLKIPSAQIKHCLKGGPGQDSHWRAHMQASQCSQQLEPKKGPDLCPSRHGGKRQWSGPIFVVPGVAEQGD